MLALRINDQFDDFRGGNLEVRAFGRPEFIIPGMIGKTDKLQCRCEIIRRPGLGLHKGHAWSFLAARVPAGLAKSSQGKQKETSGSGKGEKIPKRRGAKAHLVNNLARARQKMQMQKSRCAWMLRRVRQRVGLRLAGFAGFSWRPVCVLQIRNPPSRFRV